MKLHKSMASFLPDEIIIEILSCLPVKSLIRFKCVCKDWFDLIKNPSFAQTHLQRATQIGNFNLISNDDGHVYSIDYNDVVSPPNDDDEVEQITYPFYSPRIKFLSYPSCNGLFCLNIDIIPDPVEPLSYEINCIWNPATKESEEIPYDDYNQSHGSSSYKTFGFGYDYKTKVYKVVSIVYYFWKNDDILSIVKVYTLGGSNSWRRIEDIPYQLTYIGEPGIYVNGALHWVAKHGNKRKLSSEELIVSLDLGDEEYREVPQPEYSDEIFDMNVGELEGCLCIICTNILKTHIDLWMMKEYGVKKSWNKLFNVTIDQELGTDQVVRLTPIKILKNGKILLNNCGLKLYDPTDKQLRRLEIQGNSGILPQFDAVAYVGSLISLKSNKYHWPRGGKGASRT